VEWETQREAREWARVAAEEARELEAETDGLGVAEGFATQGALAVGRLLAEARHLEGAEQRRLILGAVRELTELRRTNAAMERERREREQWDFERAEQERERAKAEEKARKAAEDWAKFQPFLGQAFPEQFDENGEQRDFRGAGAALPKELRECLRVNAELLARKAMEGEASGGIQPNQSKSDQIKPTSSGERNSAPGAGLRNGDGAEHGL